MRLETLNDIFFNAVSRELPRVMTTKRHGRWVDISCGELREQVLKVASELKRRGIGKGGRVAILSENRPEWQIVDFACLLLGAVDVPVYTTLTGEQVARLLNDSGVRHIFVSTKEQLQKVNSIRAETAIQEIFVMDDAESAEIATPFSRLLVEPLTDADALEAGGRAIQPSDLATIIYTSGTTGNSKGAMLTHGNIASNLHFSLNMFEPAPGDLSVSFLPLSHITARHIDYAYLQDGVTLAYCQHMDGLPQVFQEMRPTFLVAVPRVYEKVYNKVQHEAHGFLKKAVYDWALRVGTEHVDEIANGETPASFRWKLADKLVFGKIKQGFGGRARYFLSGGAPLGKELAVWYAKVGICIYEGYGLTETSPVIAVNTPAANRLGTVGRVLPNEQVKIAADGELLVRGPNVFQGYWNLPKETTEAFVDGWFKTGDIGTLDADGFLSITDRKKDLIKTSGGKFIAPQPLETSLKTDPLVSQAAIIGDRRKFPAVIIAPQFSVLEKWAGEKNVPFTSRVELVHRKEVQRLYEDIVGGLNADLAQYEKLKKVLLVPDEFSIATGELTPSLKLKRRVVEQKYKSEIEALYSEEALPVPASK